MEKILLGIDIELGVLAKETNADSNLEKNFPTGSGLISYTDGYNSSQANSGNELTTFQNYFECSFFTRL